MTNDTSELRAILRRVDTLEAENRRLKHLGLAALILLGSLAVMGQTASKDRIVEARAFVLRDVNGKSRATLGLSPDGPFLRMWGPGGGNEQVLLSLDDRGPSLAFADPDGKRRVVLTIFQEHPLALAS